MITIFIRTIVFYIILIISARIMGKRQMGEIQVTEFIAVIMLSELAALPISDRDIPPAFGVIPLLTIAALEITVSFVCRKSTAVRSVIEGQPIILIAKGEILQKNLTKARISLDEIFAEMRSEGYCDITEINYVILEQTGKMSVIPKAKHMPPSSDDLKISVDDKGMRHIVVIDGSFREYALKSCGISAEKAERIALSRGKKIKDLSYMIIDDEGNVTLK